MSGRNYSCPLTCLEEQIHTSIGKIETAGNEFGGIVHAIIPRENNMDNEEYGCNDFKAMAPQTKSEGYKDTCRLRE